MKHTDVIAVDSYLIDGNNAVPEYVITQLFQFAAKSYHLATLQEFHQLIIQPNIPGELTLLYGKKDEIAGFSRTCRQLVDLGGRKVTTFSAFIYLNPLYKIQPTIERAGLTHAMRYKLQNPHEELVYLAYANTPMVYDFIYQISDCIYPKPNHKTPDLVLSFLELFKKQMGWFTTNHHPLVINSPLVPLRSQSAAAYDEESDLNEFYLSINPDYLQGNSLLVYVPLHLANVYDRLSQPGLYASYSKELIQATPRDLVRLN